MSKKVNNQVYNDLGDRWWSAMDDPIALLRAENRLRVDHLSKILPVGARVLDMGCGAGLLANPLSEKRPDLRVVGVDISESALAVAERHRGDSRAEFVVGDILLPEVVAGLGEFEAVLAMDVIEHVVDRRALFRNASSRLAQNGEFHFYTFSKNWLSGLIVIKGVEWFVRNTPPNLHVYELFVSPSRLRSELSEIGFTDFQFFGVRPKFLQSAWWRLLTRGEVSPHFEFVPTGSCHLGYQGSCVKKRME